MKSRQILALAVLVLSLQSVLSKDVRSIIRGFFDYSTVSENEDANAENRIEDELPPIIENHQYSVSEDDFTKLRIEFIKQQILKKLRLKEKPAVTMNDLPNPVKENENLVLGEDEDGDGYSEDFYGKTTQAIIFPYEDESRCLSTVRYPSVCLPFQMPNDIHRLDVSSAELWFHKEPDFLDAHNQTFVVSEVAHWDTNKSFQKTKPVAIQETSLTAGWLKVDVTYVVKNWLDYYSDSPTHAINVACKTCGMEKSQSPISFSSNLKPFLVIYTHSRNRERIHRRPKRSLDCGAGVKECCRENLYVSFAEIGWDDWIIKPEGYRAYFCKGSCISSSALTLSASEHHGIIHRMMNGQSRRHESRPEITPCCTATQFAPLQLMYKVNKTVNTKVLPNMIVETCGCM